MADNRFNRTFVNDAQGNAVYVNQGAGQAGNLGGRIQNLPGGYVGGFIGDAANPSHIQRQLVVNGEVLARYGDAPNTEKLPTSSSEKPTYQNTQSSSSTRHHSSSRAPTSTRWLTPSWEGRPSRTSRATCWATPACGGALLMPTA